jgi:hypothetical protein
MRRGSDELRTAATVPVRLQARRPEIEQAIALVGAGPAAEVCSETIATRLDAQTAHREAGPRDGLGVARVPRAARARGRPPAGRRDAVRYVDVSLIAALLQDELASISLRRLFLEPLEARADGGVSLRDTLRAYFAVDRIATSAASALGANRNTVASRLREVESRIGRPLSRCGAEVEAQLLSSVMTEAALSLAVSTRMGRGSPSFDADDLGYEL